MDVTAPTLSLSAASAMAGLRPSYARGLLDARKIVLLAHHKPARDARPALRPSFLDAFRLRVIRVLLDAGLSEAAALHTLDRAIDPLLGGLAWSGIPGIPPGMLAGRLTGHAIHVVPDGTSTPDVLSRPVHYPAPAGVTVAITLNLLAVLQDVLACLPPSTAAGAAITGTNV